MKAHQGRLLLAQLHQAQAPLVLVVASLVSAVASLADADRWVGVTAALAAVVSGGIVIRSQVFIPVRVRVATRACVRVKVGTNGGVWVGSAVQVSPGIWLTAHHVIRGALDSGDRGQGPAFLMLSTGPAEASIGWFSVTHDLAVLHCTIPHAWIAGFDVEADLEEGDLLRVVGWSGQQSRGAIPALRVSQEYAVQALAGDRWFMLSGPPSFMGVGGGPAIDLTTGRVVGVALRAILPEDGGDGRRSAVVPGLFVAALSPIPSEALTLAVD